MTIDIPGVFMQVDIDELIHVQLEGPMAELLMRVDPVKFQNYMSEENDKQVLYIELQKALYDTLQVAILFWKALTKFLTEELGFTINPYDSCVMNKMIDGKQCTIIWHINDLKLSHVKKVFWMTLLISLTQSMGKWHQLLFTAVEFMTILA